MIGETEERVAERAREQISPPLCVYSLLTSNVALMNIRGPFPASCSDWCDRAFLMDHRFLFFSHVSINVPQENTTSMVSASYCGWLKVKTLRVNDRDTIFKSI